MLTRDFLRSIARATPARALLRHRYERRFRTSDGAGALSGVYATFAEAAAAAPAGAPRGYDTTAAAGLYRDLLDRLQAKDYPALFWMRDALADVRDRGVAHDDAAPSDRAVTVFDLGGHIGISFYAFREYLALPAALRWIVCDVEAVARDGASIAASRGETQLAFTTDRAQLRDADVLLASGVLQYLAEPLDDVLHEVGARPRHVVVNQMPTHATREFVTLQNIGVSFCPYRVAQIDDLPRRLAPLGYRLVDRWTDPSRRTAVPYEPDAGSVEYTGYCFRR